LGDRNASSGPTVYGSRVVTVDATVPSDGADTASIIRRGSPLYFEWVDTDSVLLHVGGGADAFMGQVGLDGAQHGTPVDATGNFRTASLSSDGRYIAYASSPTSTTAEIVVEGADASTRRRVPAFGAAANTDRGAQLKLYRDPTIPIVPELTPAITDWIKSLK